MVLRFVSIRKACRVVVMHLEFLEMTSEATLTDSYRFGKQFTQLVVGEGPKNPLPLDETGHQCVVKSACALLLRSVTLAS